MISKVAVGGEPVRLIALPAFTHKAVSAWERFVSALEADGVAGLDVESTAIEGLGAFDRNIKMRLIQFGSKSEAWALDPTNPKWRRKIVALLNNPKVRFVSHNASFDATRVLFEFDIELSDRSIDTLPMAALLWPGVTAPKGLKALCSRWIDTGLADADRELHAVFVDSFYAQKPRSSPLLPKSFVSGVSTCRKPKSKGAEKCQNVSSTRSKCGYCEEHYLARKGNTESEVWGWTHVELTNPTFLKYAGLDAVYVRRLLTILDAKLKLAKMRKISKTEQHVKRIMTGASVRGMRVDQEWTYGVLSETEVEFDAAKTTIGEITGLAPRSPKLTGWLAARGIYATSLDKDHLPELVERYAKEGDESEEASVLRAIGVVSRLSNLLANLRTIWSHATEGDGFVHPNINTQQAHTGRMSVTQPAMQTLAKKGEKGEKLRGCFISRDGFVLIGGDYDSQEIRLGAALSRDPALLRIVLEGLNQHVLTAESIFPEFTNKHECPDEYAKAKMLDFAQQYGAMPKKIAAALGISTAEALLLWQRWRQTYARLVAWTDEQATKAEVRNPFGRLIPADPFRDYANGNYLIQSSGRDVLGAALCRLDDAGWGQNIWLPIHDEIVMEVPEDKAEEGCKALTEHMTTAVKGIEIPAEGELVGTRWKGLG